MNPDPKELREDANMWCLYMFITSVVSFFSCFGQQYAFGVIGENITLNMRDKLYSSILKKHMGWFDNRDNSPGILTSVLASEAQSVRGASSEGVAVIVQSAIAMLVGLVISFSYSWRTALVALACSPFMILSGIIESKFQQGLD